MVKDYRSKKNSASVHRSPPKFMLAMKSPITNCPEDLKPEISIAVPKTKTATAWDVDTIDTTSPHCTSECRPRFMLVSLVSVHTHQSRIMANSASVTFLTLAAGALGYCFYFDYQRRHNAEFRKAIYNKKRQADKAKRLAREASKLEKTQLLKAKLVESLLTNPLSTADKEQTFISEVTTAEKLSAIVGKEIDAAIHFYRALSVYPDPTSILEIYQKSVPADIYELIMLLTAIYPPANITSLLNEPSTILETE